MKTLFCFVLIIFSYNIFSQNAVVPTAVKMATFTVKGNCEQCKKRIENAADIKGVKLATWDEKKQLLQVTYKPDKVTLEQIQKAVASSGHDIGDMKGDKSKYDKLPECCKYRDGKCEEK